MRRLLVPLAAALALACAAPAEARPDLWATVNVCDTESAPDTIGIRASLPGNGTRQALWMRFEAQFFDTALDRFVASGSSSRWMRVGSARFRRTQAGFSFAFAPPPAGSQYVLRGRVDYQYRAGGRVVRRGRLLTRRGIRGVQGADPPGRSTALCVLTP